MIKPNKEGGEKMNLTQDEILTKIHQMDSDSIGRWHDKVILELKDAEGDYHKLKDEKLLNEESLFILKQKKTDALIVEGNSQGKTEKLVNQDKEVSDLKLIIMRQRRLLSGIVLKIKDIKLKKEILRDNYFRNK